jgi:thiamine-phosphate pyrophosphorylase
MEKWLDSQGMTVFKRLMDANLSRLAEGLRVVEDVLRFELSHDALVETCKGIRNRIKIAYRGVNYGDLVNARYLGTDVRAKSTVPKRHDWDELITANIKRVTEACRCLEEASDDPVFTQIRYDIYDLEGRIWAIFKRVPIKGPGIYVISDDPAHLIAMAKKPYVPIVQYRAKSRQKSEVYVACQQIAADLRGEDVQFVVNDYVDIAMAVQADGVHLGQDDLPTPVVRAQLGPIPLIGRTTHSLDQGHCAVAEGADYVSVGPIWETPSKPDREGIGFDYLCQAASLGIPFVVIGGINTENIHEVLPYSPGLVGAIRSTHAIDDLWSKIVNN